jgi:hypothetical protein
MNPEDYFICIFATLERFRNETDFERIRLIGLRTCIQDLIDKIQCVENRFDSLIKSNIGRKDTERFFITVNLVRSSIKQVIDNLRAFWETALQQCDDQAAFIEAIKYENGSLGKQYWNLEFMLNAIGDMTASYESGTADGESTYCSAFDYLNLKKVFA